MAVAVLAFGAGSALAGSAPLTQGFEDGAPAWQATGMWHAQADPQAIRVAPAIFDKLVTLPDAGFLPAAAHGSEVAWFGQDATGTYCGADYASDLVALSVDEHDPAPSFALGIATQRLGEGWRDARTRDKFSGRLT